MVVSILATLRITKAKDEHGNEVHVQPEFTTGVAMCVFYICSQCSVLTDVSDTQNHLRVLLRQGR